MIGRAFVVSKGQGAVTIQIRMLKDRLDLTFLEGSLRKKNGKVGEFYSSREGDCDSDRLTDWIVIDSKKIPTACNRKNLRLGPTIMWRSFRVMVSLTSWRMPVMKNAVRHETS